MNGNFTYDIATGFLILKNVVLIKKSEVMDSIFSWMKFAKLTYFKRIGVTNKLVKVIKKYRLFRTKLCIFLKDT